MSRFNCGAIRNSAVTAAGVFVTTDWFPMITGIFVTASQPPGIDRFVEVSSEKPVADSGQRKSTIAFCDAESCKATFPATA